MSDTTTIYGNHPVGNETTSLRQSCGASMKKMEDCVTNSPQKAMLTSIGAGLGIGLLVGWAWGGSHRSHHRAFDRKSAEQLGHRMMARMGNWIPESVTERFSS